MPLRPRFSLAQDDEYVILTAIVPHVRVGAAELAIDGASLSLYVRPYLLKLVLPGELVDDERARATYDPSAAGGTLTVHAPKAVRGQHFPDLDLPSRLLAPRIVWPARGDGGGGGEGEARCEDESAGCDGGAMAGIPASLLQALDLGASARNEDAPPFDDDDGDLPPIAAAGAHGAALAAASAARSQARAAHDAARRRQALSRAGGPLIEVTHSIDFATAEGVGEEVSGGGAAGAAGDSAPLPLSPPPIAPTPVLDVDGVCPEGEEEEEEDAGGTGGGVDVSHLPPQGAAASSPLRSARLLWERQQNASASSPASCPPVETPPPSSRCGYGFNRSRSGVFSGALRTELALGLLELPDPEGTPPRLRPALREFAEDAAWDESRYAGDFIAGADDAVYADALSPPWWSGGRSGDAGTTHTPDATCISSPLPWQWRPDEATALCALPLLREYLIDGTLVRGGGAVVTTQRRHDEDEAVATNLDVGAPPTPSLQHRPESRRILASLATLLFGYAYDHRTSGGEASVESSWTIATLAPCLSWLDDELIPPPPPPSPSVNPGAVAGICAPPTPRTPLDERALALEALVRSLRDESAPPPPSLEALAAAAVNSCVRRALIYPYLRRWDIALLCAADAATLLLCGLRPVLRALLGVRAILGGGGDTSEGGGGEGARYLFNTLLLDDLSVWLQCAPTADADVRAMGAAVAAAVAGLAGPEGKRAAAFARWDIEGVEARALAAAAEGGSEGGEEEAEVVVGEDELDDEEEEEEEEEDSSDSSPSSERCPPPPQGSRGAAD